MKRLKINDEIVNNLYRYEKVILVFFMNQKQYIFFIFATCFTLWSGCNTDHGLGTLDSKITGDIIFLNMEKKPDYIEAVRIVAAVKLPPENLGDVVFTNTSINLASNQSEYDIPAPIASYELVAAVWKEKGKAWNYANILGFYGFDPVNLQFEYKKVVLSNNHPVAQHIDIICDWSLLNS